MKRAGKAVMWLLGGLGAAIVLVLGVGALLPQDHVASVERRVAGAPEEVWRVITDVERMPEWRPEVDRVERLAGRGALPVWRESGAGGALTMEVTELDPPRRMVTRIADEGLPFGGTWSYELEPAGTGTRLRLTENGQVYNPLFRFVSRFLIGHERTMNAYLDALEGRMGGG